MTTRMYWLYVLFTIAEPVLVSLEHRRFKRVFPSQGERDIFTHLEAFGRLIAGFAPWLELDSYGEPEQGLRRNYRRIARSALSAAVDPESPDYMNFTEGTQPLVDAAFLAHAILRAPRELWEELDSQTQVNLIRAFRLTRGIQPYYNNWLLFSAMVEAAMYRMGQDWDPMRVDLAVRKHDEWYLGDGTYGDGPPFHWDYYNSYVIQPFLLDIVNTLSPESQYLSDLYPKIHRNAQRYSMIQERLISPEGTYPAIGRSITYRFGAFQLLAQMALMEQLPVEVSPAQVRSALTAVIRRQFDMPGTLDPNGWLQVGFAGNQPSLKESYISAGSCYLCATGLLPLGLPETSSFWADPDEEWTSRKIWSGGVVAPDKSI